MRETERKKDTRQKIQLGGLVVKAGLRNTDKAVILGILTDGVMRLSRKDERERYHALGKAAFGNDVQATDVDSNPGHFDADDSRRTFRD